MPARDPDCLVHSRRQAANANATTSSANQTTLTTTTNAAASSSSYVPSYAPVRVNVYRLFEEGKCLEAIDSGIHHSGVEVYGLEHGYGRGPSGTGLFQIVPKTYCVGRYTHAVAVGMTRLSEREVEILSEELSRIDSVVFGGSRRDACGSSGTGGAFSAAIRAKYGMGGRGRGGVAAGGIGGHRGGGAVDSGTSTSPSAHLLATRGESPPTPPDDVPAVATVGAASSTSSSGAVVGRSRGLADEANEAIVASSSPPRPGASAAATASSAPSAQTVPNAAASTAPLVVNQTASRPHTVLPYSQLLATRGARDPQWKHRVASHSHLLWLGEAYHLLLHNCNNFSEVFTEMLITFTPYVRPPPRAASEDDEEDGSGSEYDEEEGGGIVEVPAASTSVGSSGAAAAGLVVSSAGIVPASAATGGVASPMRASSAFPATPLREAGVIVPRGAATPSTASSVAGGIGIGGIAPVIGGGAAADDSGRTPLERAVGGRDAAEGGEGEGDYSPTAVAGSLAGGFTSSPRDLSPIYSPAEGGGGGAGANLHAREGSVGGAFSGDRSLFASSSGGGLALAASVGAISIGTLETPPSAGTSAAAAVATGGVIVRQKRLRKKTTAGGRRGVGTGNVAHRRSLSRSGGGGNAASPQRPRNEAEEMLSLAEEDALRRAHLRQQIAEFVPRKLRVRRGSCLYGACCLCWGSSFCCRCSDTSPSQLCGGIADCWCCVPSCLANCFCGGACCCCCSACGCPSGSTAAADGGSGFFGDCCWGQEEYWFVGKGTRSRLSLADSRKLLYSTASPASSTTAAMPLFGASSEIVAPSPAFYDFFFCGTKEAKAPRVVGATEGIGSLSDAAAARRHHQQQHGVANRGALIDLVLGGIIPPPIQHRPFPMGPNRVSRLAAYCLPSRLIKVFDDYDVAMQNAMNEAFIAAEEERNRNRNRCPAPAGRGGGGGAAMTPGADMMI